jgi:hypothetical protein
MLYIKRNLFLLSRLPQVHLLLESYQLNVPRAYLCVLSDANDFITSSCVSVFGVPSEPPESTNPWFYSYQAEFLRLVRFTEHETLDHPAGGAANFCVHAKGAFSSSQLQVFAYAFHREVSCRQLASITYWQHSCRLLGSQSRHIHTCSISLNVHMFSADAHVRV